ncbi:alpha-D-mannose-specific plant lectins domain-containing protein [Dioscorea alata]|uniref:Alpha-D-mannose-specific plant lectins domain-containing protein n=1 Tax=Dioscorea alata TaxID=55571 RepID=A0ACB7USV4_DIOAL|nr:alpha-D-mannose-specific plant lectins domain-containing protein [Dioscorea alata]
MAQHHLLPLILALILLICPSSSSSDETSALFTDPTQILFSGQSLTQDDLTLSLYSNCSLILYKAGSQVLDFGTSTTTSYCALLISEEGQLQLIPDSEQTPTQTIGSETNSANYALLFTNGKLGLFGPAIWNNGVKLPTLSNSHKLTLNHNKLKAGSSDNFLASGGIVTGSANGDVVIAQNGDVSTVITPSCKLIVSNGTSGESIWQTKPSSSASVECFLRLTYNGLLLLQGYNDSGLFTQWTGGYEAREGTYVCLLRYFGRITIYRLKTWLYDGSSSAAAATAAVVAKNIKMVTA